MFDFPIATVGGFPEPAPHLSKEARRFFHEAFSRAERDAMRLPAPVDSEAWRRRNEAELSKRTAGNAELRARYAADVGQAEVGGVTVTEIRPRHQPVPGKVLLYTHGGGFVGGASHDALDSTLPLAVETGLRIVSIDYTLAPAGNHTSIGEQVLAVLSALYQQGFSPADIAVYGDSAGATIAASAMLRARASGLPLPAALVLWSPWADLACTGDSYRTLGDAEPFYTASEFLTKCARCYAGEDALSHPLVSVLYADYAAGYLPTLIQCGTRELLFSDSVRLHRRMIDAGVAVQIEIYDGLWHVFQFKPVEAPEAIRARASTGRFLLDRLGVL